MADESLDPDQIVTRYGNANSGGIKLTPKPGDSGISIVIGECSPKEAAKKVGHNVSAGYLARYARVGDLEAASFKVKSDPREFFPDHGTIEFDEDWTDDVIEALDGCFGEIHSE